MSKNINIEIPNELHKKLRLQAIKQDKTFKELFLDVLSK
jgi:hypothetical protein